MRIVQLIDIQHNRRIALVEEPRLILIDEYDSVYALAISALKDSTTLEALINAKRTQDHLPYDAVYEGTSDWRLLPAVDHPLDPRFCMVSGTGLTHKASAENRQKMHDAQAASQLTDSMKIYQWGLEGGKPAPGGIGVQPEWFYKGNGSVLKPHNAVLTIPNFGDDGGEEPELAAVYINDETGTPHRIGFATANEFSDHVMEKKNYLYLAPSKIRNCAIGPELVLAGTIEDVPGEVSVERQGKTLWKQAIKTGETHMAHSIRNLEYHHFKYDNHRLPFDLHVHFLGADAFSFGAGIQLAEGDTMRVQWEGMGRPLLNTVGIDARDEVPLQINNL
ncbi:AraD1 family protein [Salmonirosea aquatica]|uniref:GguC protein n=1 Tax=Salmonirosea aquatica TaxID=2654236 RepID=A0A7C9BA00_9BACT|nr:GguC protein [Cytophagaceae bacterium SJW1-29]